MNRDEKIKKDKAECVILVKQLCLQNNIEYSELIKKIRKEPLVDVRRAIIHYLRELKFSFPVIGYALNKNHTTIIYHYKIAKNFLKYDKKFKRLYQEFTKSNWEKRAVNLLKDSKENIVGLFDYSTHTFYKVIK